MRRSDRSASGDSQIVNASVITNPENASTPTGSRILRRPIPRAVSAMISLSADIRPSPSSTPIKIAMGTVKVKTPGKIHRKSFRTCEPLPLCRTNSSISRTSCGTKKTNVKTTSPNNAWRKTSRTI